MKSSNRSNLKRDAVTLAFFCIIVFTLFIFYKTQTWNALLSTLFFLIRTYPIVVLVLYIVSVSLKKGYMDRLNSALSPILSKAGLSDIAALSVTTSFLSPVASYSMLSQAWREGRVGDREVIAVSFLNSFPSVFSHLYSFFLPFVIPVLGFAGVVYTLIRLAVALVKTVIGYFLAVKWAENVEIDVGGLNKAQISVSENAIRVGVVMVVTYFIATFLFELGIFNVFNPNISALPLPSSSIAIALVEVVNFRAAVVLGASFLSEGAGWKWIVVGLMLGNVISFSTRSVKHSLPMHLSLFGRFGVKIVLLNSAATLLLDLAVIILLLLI